MISSGESVLMEKEHLLSFINGITRTSSGESVLMEKEHLLSFTNGTIRSSSGEFVLMRRSIYFPLSTEQPGPHPGKSVLADVRLLDGLLISAVRRGTTLVSYSCEPQKSGSQERDEHAKQICRGEDR